MKERVELDLRNPIFAVYINTSGLTMQRKDELVQNYRDNLDVYSNITMWFFADQDVQTRIELVYNGSKDTSEAMQRFALEINKAIDLISETSDFNDFKSYIRSFRLNNLIDE